LNPCLLIPIYNHGAAIADVVASLESLGLPCLVVDDGSHAATRRELDRLDEKYGWLEVAHLARNGGRGVALRAGYRLALQRGMTHVLQLDADGQHDAADAPRMLQAARERPDAVILGTPIFDDSAPLARLYGRKLSQALVWLETLSFAIHDPLCGFRCFPLEPTVALLDRVGLGDRMDFDPELVVRLHWSGMPIVNVPTKVIYPKGGLSNFRLVHDNALITWLHVRLVLGGVVRMPWLLARRRGAAT
jgi:glycosyltransferase involved in cell wall biosynthesis